MATAGDKSVKYKAISGRFSEHFGFKLSSDGTVSSAENVYCVHCHKSFAFHGSNTSLCYHLQHVHPLQYQKVLDSKPTVSSSDKSQQSKLSQFLRRNDRPVSSQLQQDINTSLATWIATSGQPISIVEDEGLQQTFRIALQNDSFRMPSRRTVDGLLSKMYDSELLALKTRVEQSNAIAITSDFWASMGNKSYCGITGHWINGEWQIESAALECLNVEERHFSANVAELYENFAADWGISSKIRAVVTDNAGNMTAAVAKTAFQHIPCLAHTLQFSILVGFKEADTNQLFAKCRKIVGHFKHSAANTTELEKFNDSDSPLHKLQQDVPTRWNSICIMMKSLLQAKEAVITYMASPCGKSFKAARLLDSDWEKMFKYVEVLDLFCQATELLGGDKYVSCSSVLPVLYSLTKHLTVHDDDPGYIARFKAVTLADFQARVTGMNAIEVIRIATALDPRYKSLRCLSEEDKCETWTSIHEQMTAVSDAGQSNLSVSVASESEPEHATKRLKLMDSDSDTEDIAETTAYELGRYKLEKKLGDGEDPLLWWKINQNRFPSLASLAKTVLCIPATSVSCERLFSSAGYIMNKTRCSLDPQNVTMLVCLRDWLHK